MSNYDRTQRAIERLKVHTHSGLSSGWLSMRGNPWTYASASTFTTVGDQTDIYKKGLRLRWTQTTVKFGVVLADSTYGAGVTTVSIIVNTSYVFTAAAITDNSVTFGTPADWPGWFTYLPTWNGTGGGKPDIGNGTLTGRYFQDSLHLHHQLLILFGASTDPQNTTAWYFSLAAPMQNTAFAQLGLAHVRDAATNNYDRVAMALYSLGSQIVGTFIQMDSATNVSVISYNAPFTFATSDSIYIDIWTDF